MNTCNGTPTRTTRRASGGTGRTVERLQPRRRAGMAMKALATVAVVCAPGMAAAQASSISSLWTGWPESLSRAEHWRVAVSPFTQHWRPSDEHRMVRAVALERFGDDGRFWGVSYFTNSFGQPSGYAFIGQRYMGILGQPSMYAQWSGGIMYGYTGKYQHKVPLNVNGFSPGFVPSIGFKFTPNTAFQYNLLGDAGVMFQISHDWR